MSAGDPEIGLDDAYAVDGPEENRELYRRWASTYEESFIAAEGYHYHQRVASIFVEVGASGPVLDVGCGTGVVGVELRRLGTAPIDGVDISRAMLDQASDKETRSGKVYRRLIEADLTGPVDIASDSYAGVISAGTFTHGHLGPRSLGELIRVAAPGAWLVIGINSAHFAELGFDRHLEALVVGGLIGEYELVTVPIYDDSENANPDRVSNVAVFTVI